VLGMRPLHLLLRLAAHLLEVLNGGVHVGLVQPQEFVQLRGGGLERSHVRPPVALGRDEVPHRLSVPRHRDRCVGVDVVRQTGSELTDADRVSPFLCIGGRSS
jgi:hypothetical protein